MQSKATDRGDEPSISTPGLERAKFVNKFKRGLSTSSKIPPECAGSRVFQCGDEREARGGPPEGSPPSRVLSGVGRCVGRPSAGLDFGEASADGVPKRPRPGERKSSLPSRSLRRDKPTHPPPRRSVSGYLQRQAPIHRTFPRHSGARSPGTLLAHRRGAHRASARLHTTDIWRTKLLEWPTDSLAV